MAVSCVSVFFDVLVRVVVRFRCLARRGAATDMVEGAGLCEGRRRATIIPRERASTAGGAAVF